MRAGPSSLDCGVDSLHARDAPTQGPRIKDSAAAGSPNAASGLVSAALSVGRFVVLLPLVVDQKPLGLFYIDGDQSGGPC